MPDPAVGFQTITQLNTPEFNRRIGLMMMQGIVKPKRLEFDKKTRSDNYAKYKAGPFERGYGTTVGNSLRRMLLSSIEGAAVIGVKFEGVFHEFGWSVSFQKSRKNFQSKPPWKP